MPVVARDGAEPPDLFQLAPGGKARRAKYIEPQHGIIHHGQAGVGLDAHNVGHGQADEQGLEQALRHDENGLAAAVVADDAIYPALLQPHIDIFENRFSFEAFCQLIYNYNISQNNVLLSKPFSSLRRSRKRQGL